jgi:3-isopropylmalate dehydrogenase
VNKRILIFPGDGIGPEVTTETVKVFQWFTKNTSHHFDLVYGLIGGAAIDEHGLPLSDETLSVAKQVDSVLLGAVGGPKWDHIESQFKPEKGLLQIRKALGLFSNLRPVFYFPALKDVSSLKNEIIQNLDLMIVRELTGDVYFGEPRSITGIGKDRRSINTMSYDVCEIDRIARVAFELAKNRHKKVCSVDKANVLEVSALWREIVQWVHDTDYTDIALSHMYVDNAAMQLIRYPQQFDVMLTGNLFGDILSDEASMLMGSLGMLPSASIGAQYSLYEPIHGSAPDIAGKNIANPLGAILSVAMMFEYTFGLKEEAQCIFNAVNAVLNQGYRTKDIFQSGCELVSTEDMGDRVIEAVERLKSGGIR